MAKAKTGTTGVGQIAEFHINGVEVVQLMEDDSDLQRLLERARGLGYDDRELVIISEMIESGEVPCESAGFGIGIERLCQACLGLPSIWDVVVSREFVREFPRT